MAPEPDSGGIRPSTLYSFLSSIYLSMFLVLVASSKPEDHWFRIFMTVYLIGMQLFFVVMLFVSQRSEKQKKIKPAVELPVTPDRPGEGGSSAP
jgi:hypothetical protein